MRMVMLLCLTLLVAACGDEHSTGAVVATPTAPTVTTPSGFTVSGVVTNAISGRPIQGATVWLLPVSAYGQFRPYDRTTSTSDAAGRYQITGVLNSGRAWITAGRNNDYSQPCATSVTLGDVTVDLQLVAESDLFLFNLRTPAAIAGTRSVSGAIYRVGASGRQPVSNAYLLFDPIGDSPVAWSKSDGSGHYLLCGLPDAERVVISAAGPLSPAFSSITLEPARGNSNVDIDIP